MAAIVALVLAVALAACSGSSEITSSSSEAEETSLDVIVPVHGDVLEPTRLSVNGLASLLLGAEPLVRYSSGGELTPALAASVEEPDPTTYVFTIREDVTFWDGTPLSPDDVVFSFGLHADPDSESLHAPFWLGVEAIEATGDNEVTVTLTQPNSAFLYTVAQTPILSEAFYAEHGDAVGTPDVLNMGTGPYEFVSFRPSSETVLEANDDYWGGEPPWDRLTLSTINDDSARLNAVQSGEYDVVYNIPIAQYDAFAGVDGLTIAEASDLLVYKFNFDTTQPPFDDVHLRRAFMHAVDREDIVAGALGGQARLAPAVVPPEILSSGGEEAAVEETFAALEEDLAFDLDAAREELAQSSSPDGVEVELLTIASDPNLSLIAQTAAQTLAEIGITLTISQVDDNTYYEAVYFTHQVDGVSLDGFSGPDPAPITMPRYSLSSAFGLPKGGQGSNIADYDNPQVDALLEQATMLPADDPQAIGLILESLEAAQADAPYVPIAYPQVYAGAREGLTIEAFDTFWWMADWPSEVSG
ncbi:MAG TPA: ABC transporter substrate-binding protein [Euzebya sp.]|nr:ABC transporter substrate-binding protein [Euzebya sp.]